MPLRGDAVATSCAWSTAGAAGSRCAWSSSCASTTARSCRGSTRLDDGTLRAIAGPDTVVLRTPVPLRGEDLTTRRRVRRARPGETVPFVLTYAPSHLPPPAPIDPAAALARHRGVLARVVRALRRRRRVARGGAALADHAEGADLRARPAASSPRRPRRCRSSSAACATGTTASAGCATPRFTLLALMNAGYHDEAQAWRDWLLRAVAGAPAQMQIMYGARRRAPPRPSASVPWLPGYEGAAPVRIGNAAARPAAARRLRRGDGRAATRRAAAACAPTRRGWALQRALLEYLETVWDQPDEGIWEVRGAARATSPTRR